MTASQTRTTLVLPRNLMANLRVFCWQHNLEMGQVLADALRAFLLSKGMRKPDEQSKITVRY